MPTYPPFRGLLAATLLVLAGFTAGCELLGPDETPEVFTTGVLVANQGNFTDGNGSVSVYDPATRQVNAAPIGGLGSIVQSLHAPDDFLYVVANTGDRIDVFAQKDFTRTAQIGGLVSPRYMVQGLDGKAYVTNLFGDAGSYSGGKVSVLDLPGTRKLKDIPVGDNPEGLARVGHRLYVANHGFGAGRTVTVIDTATETVVQTIDVGCDGPRFLAADAENEVYVLCTGQTLYDGNFNVVGETKGAVRILNGATGAVTHRIDLDGRISTIGPGQDAFFAPEADELYVVQDGHTVLRFDTRTNTRTATIGPLPGAPIGAVAYDVTSERLYVAHVPGFTERGTVTLHDRTGAEVDRFTAGIAPAFFLFLRAER